MQEMTSEKYILNEKGEVVIKWILPLLANLEWALCIMILLNHMRQSSGGLSNVGIPLSLPLAYGYPFVWASFWVVTPALFMVTRANRRSRDVGGKTTGIWLLDLFSGNPAFIIPFSWKPSLSHSTKIRVWILGTQFIKRDSRKIFTKYLTRDLLR